MVDFKQYLIPYQVAAFSDKTAVGPDGNQIQLLFFAQRAEAVYQAVRRGAKVTAYKTGKSPVSITHIPMRKDLISRMVYAQLHGWSYDYTE